MALKEQVVVITGASRGLGRALALAFHAAGAKLVLNATTPNELKATAQETSAIDVVGDVTKPEDMNRLAEVALSNYGRIDIWVNNAGIWMPHTMFEHVPLERFRTIMEVNYFGTLYGTYAAYQHMLAQRSGTIVNILSMRVKANVVGTSAYVSAKGAAWMLTNTLRLEARPHGISVFGVFPSGMKTSLFQEHRPDKYDSYMDPTDVAEKIVRNLEKKSPVEDLVIKKP